MYIILNYMHVILNYIKYFFKCGNSHGKYHNTLCVITM